MPLSDSILRSCPAACGAFLKRFFASCPSYVSDMLCLAEYSKGRRLMSADDSCSYVYILLRGRLYAVEEHIGEIPYCFTEISPIEIVGDFELLAGTGRRYVTLAAAEDSSLLILPANSYMTWIRGDADALFLRIQMLSRQMAAQTRMERQFLFLDYRLRFLLLLYQECLKQKGTEPPYHILQTRDMLSRRTGCSVRTLNRILSHLSGEGFFSCVHGKLQVDEAQLESLRAYLQVQAEFFFLPDQDPGLIHPNWL